MDSEKKQALLPAGESKVVSEPKSYWQRVAVRYRTGSRVLLVSLLLFIVIFMSLFARIFTYDSFFCLAKDLQTVSAYIPSKISEVTATYEEGAVQVLPYRGGIAFVNRGGVEVYSPNGERMLDVTRAFVEPRAVASRKYLLAYESGGNTFLLTNSYAELYHGTTEYPILGAHVSDSGHFALITASDTALSQVLLYDGNFRLLQRFSRASATVGVSVSANGKRIALYGMTAEGSTPCSVLDVYRLGHTEPVFSQSFSGELPLALGFTDAKHLALLTDKNLHFLHAESGVKASIPYTGNCLGFTCGEEGILFAFETDPLRAAFNVVMLDKKGSLKYEHSATGDIKAMALGEKQFYLLLNDSVQRVHIKKGHMQELAIEAGATDIFTVGRGSVRVVYPAKAVYLSFSDL